MKKYLYLIVFIAIFATSCDKEEVLPTSSFTFNGEDKPILRIGTNDDISFINNSQQGDSYLWDFGDGRHSYEKDVVLYYPEAGTYDVTLVTTNLAGQKSESKKKVEVLNRVLKKIIIETVQWKTSSQEDISFRWPKSTTADIYFQIKEYNDPNMEPLGIYPDNPVIYTSPVIKDVSNMTYDPIVIPVNEKIIIDKINGSSNPFQAVQENLSKVNLYSLMAVDEEGETYNLYHNHGGGGNSIRVEEEDISKNSFILDFSLFSRIRLICEYE